MLVKPDFISISIITFPIGKWDLRLRNEATPECTSPNFPWNLTCKAFSSGFVTSWDVMNWIPLDFAHDLIKCALKFWRGHAKKNAKLFKVVNLFQVKARKEQLHNFFGIIMRNKKKWKVFQMLSLVAFLWFHPFLGRCLFEYTENNGHLVINRGNQI